MTSTEQKHIFGVSLSIPRSFSLGLRHTEGCFLSVDLGSDLITYLFSLSYSKLLWLLVLLRTDIFFPPLLPAAFQPLLRPTPADTVHTLLISHSDSALYHLCHFPDYLPFSSGQIASVICNSLRGDEAVCSTQSDTSSSVSVPRWI